MAEFASLHSDFLLFAAAGLGAVGLMHFFFWRGARRSSIPLVAWLVMLSLIGIGWFAVPRGAEREQTRLKQTIEGFAPTYASGMENLGHNRITLETDPEDPDYLRMIEAQKRWLAVNPAAHDIYTYRRSADGVVHYIVDSETDYDRNGVIEGENEERTDIGEENAEPDEPMLQALDGHTTFNPEPIADRWGVWVSAYTPITGPDGKVEAGLGVDFDAREWIAAGERGRRGVIAVLGGVAAALSGLAIAASLTVSRQETVERARHHTQLKGEHHRFEMLVDAIDGIVYEWNCREERYEYVSKRASAVLGYSPGEWQEPGFWLAHLHPDDRDWANAKSDDHARRSEPYEVQYRMVARDGRTVWIRETGCALHSATGEPLAVRGVLHDITAQKEAAAELEAVNKQLVETSRQAGMAEVASGVLHNVGNVLNSVNVSSMHIHERLRQSRVSNLKRLATMVLAEAPRLAEFLTTDERGRIVPRYLDQLADAIMDEHADLRKELDSLLRNLEHIKDIVMVQQSCARVSGRTENFDVHTLLDDALRINDSAFSRHRIRVEREFGTIPQIMGDRHKTLQILVNLVRNAKQALDASPQDTRLLTISTGADENGSVAVHIRDNGVGIAPENITRIFQHGFTTRKTGHGFGLHISALSARELGGNLSLHSDGPGKGAVFTLTLPATAPAPRESALQTS